MKTMEEVVSPNTGKIIGHWQNTSESELDSLTTNLPGELQTLFDTAYRQHLLENLAATLTRDKSEFVSLIIDETGKTPEEADAEVDYAVSFLHYGASVCQHSTKSDQNGERVIREVSAGPALLMTAYNDPLAGITRKIAPAIAAGCPAVVKPSPLAQLTAEALFKRIKEAGFNKVLHCVNHTDSDIIKRLVSHPVFRVFSFTGSTRTGLQLSSISRTGIQRQILELGGNNPFLVLDGANIEQAAIDAVARKIKCAGQACSAQNRIYVAEHLFKLFRDCFYAKLEQLTYGQSDSGVQMGPVRSTDLLDKLHLLSQQSAEHGKVHTLGKAEHHQHANCFAPTVVETDNILNRYEAFGPLVSLMSIKSKAKALHSLESEQQALVCYLYGDISQTDTNPLRFGSIGINSTAIQSADVPTGGFGNAGMGREGGAWGLQEFSTTINERWN